MIALTVAQYFLQSSLEAMWGLINTSQLVFYIPLMGITLPPNTLYLFQFLAFFNGDLYILVRLYELSIGLILDT